MKRIKFNKRICLSLMFTFLFLGVTAFTFYPKSYSIYLDSDTDALVYDASFSALNLNVSWNEDKSFYHTAVFNFSFESNNIAKNSDVYILDIPGCSITSVKPKENFQGNTITYDHISNNVTHIVEFSCPVESLIDSNGDLPISVTIKENPDSNGEFIYLSKELKVEDYYSKKHKPDPVVDLTKEYLLLPDELTSQKKYDAFITWIGNNTLAEYQNQVLDYINSKYSKENLDSILDTEDVLNGLSIKKFNHLDELQGLIPEDDISKLDVTSGYLYQFTENFVGYARTHYTRSTVPKFMYFSTTVKEEIEKAFLYYIEQIYPNEVDAIKKYVESKGGIASVILPDSDGKYKTIAGVYYLAEKQQLVVESLLNHAFIYKNKIIQIGLDKDAAYMFLDVFVEALPTIYSDIVSQELYAELKKDDIDLDKYIPIMDSITKNNMDTEIKTSYNEYFPIYDPGNKSYLIFNVFSNAGSGLAEDQYTYVTVKKLETTEDLSDVSIDFVNNGNNKIDVTIISTDKTKNLNLIKSIDNYFAVVTEILEDYFTTDDLGNIKVNYILDTVGIPEEDVIVEPELPVVPPVDEDPSIDEIIPDTVLPEEPSIDDVVEETPEVKEEEEILEDKEEVAEEETLDEELLEEIVVDASEDEIVLEDEM